MGVICAKFFVASVKKERKKDELSGHSLLREGRFVPKGGAIICLFDCLIDVQLIKSRERTETEAAGGADQSKCNRHAPV